MEFDIKKLEEKFTEAPESIQLALSSTEVASKVRNIGSTHNLMLDQMDALNDHITFALLGLTSTGDFVKNLAKDADLNEEEAAKISKDVDAQIFAELRSSMREGNGSSPVQGINSYHAEKEAIGRAGGFEIEHHPEIADNVPSKVPNYGGFVPKPPSQPSPSVPPPAPFKAPEPKTESKTEPLVDQLLRGTASLPQDKVTKEPETPKHTPPKPISFGSPKPTTPPTPPKPTPPKPTPPAPTPQTQPPKNLPTSDPYRELPQ